MPMPAETRETARLRCVSNQPVTQAIIGAKIAAVAAPTIRPKTIWNWMREVVWLAKAMLAESITDPAMGGLVVALDVLGGQFAWVPAKPGKRPTIHYFGPDLLEWQDLEQGYADWLYNVLKGSLASFYETLRWPEWEAEAQGLGLDQGIYAYPPPWSVQGKDLSTSTRKPVPMGELVAFHHDTAKWINTGTEGK